MVFLCSPGCLGSHFVPGWPRTQEIHQPLPASVGSKSLLHQVPEESNVFTYYLTSTSIQAKRISCNPANNHQGEVHFLGYRESWKSGTMSSAKDVGVDEEQKTLVPLSSGSASNAPGGTPVRGSLPTLPGLKRRACGDLGPVNMEDWRRAGPGARARPGTDGRAQTV